MHDRTDLSEIENAIAVKLTGVRYSPGTAAKRFARDYGNGFIKQLSPRGRKFMAWIANRYRRQLQFSSEEHAWVLHWLFFEDLASPNLGVSSLQAGSIGGNPPIKSPQLAKSLSLPFPE